MPSEAECKVMNYHQYMSRGNCHSLFNSVNLEHNFRMDHGSNYLQPGVRDIYVDDHYRLETSKVLAPCKLLYSYHDIILKLTMSMLCFPFALI